MKNIFLIITVVSSVMLIIAILLQNQGSGLGSAFGGESSFYRSKRGAEKALFILTIILSIIFVASILGSLLLFR